MQNPDVYTILIIPLIYLVTSHGTLVRMLLLDFHSEPAKWYDRLQMIPEIQMLPHQTLLCKKFPILTEKCWEEINIAVSPFQNEHDEAADFLLHLLFQHQLDLRVRSVSQVTTSSVSIHGTEGEWPASATSPTRSRRRPLQMQAIIGSSIAGDVPQMERCGMNPVFIYLTPFWKFGN